MSKQAREPVRAEEEFGRRIALLSVTVGVALSVSKIVVGWLAGSAAVMSDGYESAGDVFSSAIVYAGLWLASKPPDNEHPYGHGRYETLSGLAIAVILLLAGIAVIAHGVLARGSGVPVRAFALYPLAAAAAIKGGLALQKFRTGRKISSLALQADAFHDVTDLASTGVAFAAVVLSLVSPHRFAYADRVGAIVIGVLMVLLSLRLHQRIVEQLLDTMPSPSSVAEIRQVALRVPGALGIEKCFARRTGLRYHVDLHLEVDPDLTVRESHEIAKDDRTAVRQDLDWVADVLVHVEPSSVVVRH